MNKYFIEILKNRTLLTIPSFGALTVANRKTGKIVFNSNLTFDDNVLSDYIADKEGIDKVEAKNTIAKFVREIEAILDKGETYDIFEFGKFYKNDKGEVVFESTISSIEKDVEVKKEEGGDEKVVSEDDSSETKKENVYIPPVSKSVDEVKNEEKIATSSSLDDLKNKFKKTEKSATKEVKEVKEKADKSVSSSIDDIKNKYKKTEKKVVDEVKDTKKEVVAAVSSSKDDIKNKFKKSNKTTEKPKKDKKVKEKGEKKKRRVLPLILLLLLLVGIGVGGYFYQDKIKTLLGLNKTEHSKEQGADKIVADGNENHNANAEEDETDSELGNGGETVDDNSANEETDNNGENLNDENSENTTDEVAEEEVTEETVEEVKPEPVVNSSVNGNYHIIGGAFGEESNATKFAEKTGGKVLGKFNGLYQVAIKSFDTRSDASSGLKQLSSEYPSAWILKYPK